MSIFWILGGRLKGSELVQRMRSTREEFEGLLSQLTADQMTRPGVAGEWSVKDMLAHIAWYEAEEAAFYGETGVPASTLWEVPQDPRNEMLFRQSRSRPLEEVLAEFRRAHERFVEIVERLSAADLHSPGRFPGTSEEWPPWRKIAVHSFDHDREHIDMVRAWLERDGGPSE